MRLAMIGTRGVPARYGGFETAVEQIGARLADQGHEVIVYCRNPGQRVTEFRGMHLVNLPAIRSRTMETLSHSIASSLHAVVASRPDAAFVFNPANAPVIAVLRAAGIPVAINVDGLESQRAKWAGPGARYLRWAERASMNWADTVIADSRVIADHVRERSGREAVYIPYGAGPADPRPDRLSELGLCERGFILVVARFEPENQVDRIIAAYAEVPGHLPLVVVGHSPYSRHHVARIRELADTDPRVHLLGAIHDQQLLDTLYAGARIYIHGHSVGGTNPSLLRALRAAPVLAFDSPFSREVAGYAAAGYWTDQKSLVCELIRMQTVDVHEPATDVIDARFDWRRVTEDYLRVAFEMSDNSALLSSRNISTSEDGLPLSYPRATVSPSSTTTGRGA